MVVAQQLDGVSISRDYCRHAYWGPEFSEHDFATVLRDETGRMEQAGCVSASYDSDDALCRDAAQAISEGQVVGWFQGRLEWGPRALGNRSILGDPRRADMKDILNAKSSAANPSGRSRPAFSARKSQPGSRRTTMCLS
jgi:carbamoyltransferase